MQISERLSIWKITAFWGWWKVIAGVFLLAGIYDLAQGQIPAINLPSLQQVISWWDWKIWFISALALLLFGTLEGTYRLVKRLKSKVLDEVNENKRLDRKKQRGRYTNRQDIPDHLFSLFTISKRIAEENINKQAISLEQKNEVANELASGAGVTIGRTFKVAFSLSI